MALTTGASGITDQALKVLAETITKNVVVAIGQQHERLNPNLIVGMIITIVICIGLVVTVWLFKRKSP